MSVLTQLKELVLSSSQVTDLSPLSILTQLNLLDLSNTQVTDLSPLSVLTHLNRLDLRNTQVTNLSMLKHLDKLTIVTDSKDKLELWRSQGIKVQVEIGMFPK